MATIEAVNHRGRAVLTLLALDTPASAGVPSGLQILVGTEEKLHVQGGLRGFLQAERASFIPQDVALTEESLLQEQDALPQQTPEEEAAEEAEAGAARTSSVPGSGTQ